MTPTENKSQISPNIIEQNKQYFYKMNGVNRYVESLVRNKDNVEVMCPWYYI